MLTFFFGFVYIFVGLKFEFIFFGWDVIIRNIIIRIKKNINSF